MGARIAINRLLGPMGLCSSRYNPSGQHMTSCSELPLWSELSRLCPHQEREGNDTWFGQGSTLLIGTGVHTRKFSFEEPFRLNMVRTDRRVGHELVPTTLTTSLAHNSQLPLPSLNHALNDLHQTFRHQSSGPTHSPSESSHSGHPSRADMGWRGKEGKRRRRWRNPSSRD